MVAVPKTCQKTPFVTPRMPLRYLWAGSPCRRGPRALFIDRLGIGSVPVCYAEMALGYLWAGVPCRRGLWLS